MIFPQQTKWRKGILNTSVKWNCPRGTRSKYEQTHQNFALTKELNENADKSTKFWLKICQDWALAREYMMRLTLRSIQFCHANNKQVIMRCCSYNYGLIVLVMFGNLPNCNRPGGSSNFGKISKHHSYY
jgi:hypothetical protein